MKQVPSMRYNIKPSTLSGSITASPSKSHTLRAILFATLAHGTSRINHYLHSPDTDAMIQACTLLGAHIIREPNQLIVIGTKGTPKCPDDVINCGNSGQVLRFVGAIAGLLDANVVLTGDHSVRYNRPIKPLLDGLTQLGAQCTTIKNDHFAPVIIKGPIHSGTTRIDGQDSQPVSGLLIAASMLNGTTQIQVDNPGEKPWIDLTLFWFDRLGIQYQRDSYDHFTLHGSQKINGFNFTVPGDFSSVAYPIAAALVTRSEVHINNIDINDAQGDKKIIDALKKMGANITVDGHSLTVHKSGLLSGCDIDVNDFIDAVTILAVVGCYAQNTTTLKNAYIARKKESDRLATITSELKKMGAKIVEHEESLIIQQSVLQGGAMQSFDDHRIAMSCAVAALGANSNSSIDNAHCVAKSYANFVSDLTSLGAHVEVQV